MQGGLQGTVVESGTFSPKNAAAIEIEDNDGFALSAVVLDDGFDAKLQVLFDSALTWPSAGDTVLLKRPRDAAPLACLLTSIEDAVTRKKEATLSLALSYRPGIALS